MIAVTERQEMPSLIAGSPAVCHRSSSSSAFAPRRRTTGRRPGFPADGIPYERSGHHLSIVKAIAAGQQILPDRQALVDRFRAVTGVGDSSCCARRRSVRQVAPLISHAEGAILPSVGMREVEPILGRGLSGSGSTTPTSYASRCGCRHRRPRRGVGRITPRRRRDAGHADPGVRAASYPRSNLRC